MLLEVIAKRVRQAGDGELTAGDFAGDQHDVQREQRAKVSKERHVAPLIVDVEEI
jgi:hypothetical protein